MEGLFSFSTSFRLIFTFFWRAGDGESYDELSYNSARSYGVANGKVVSRAGRVLF